LAKKKISSTDLIWIFREKLSTFADCPPSIKLAIVPSEAGWTVVTTARDRKRLPDCAKRIDQLQKQLREVYVLAKVEHSTVALAAAAEICGGRLRIS
jgi:hypothetical protein